MPNINDTFFDGYYKEIWRSLIPDELTVKEIDFMLPYFKLNTESTVLDLMCGYGRHAIALAKKGISVTAVDNLGYYIHEIVERAEKEELPLKAIQSDVTGYKGEDLFDLILCMGNSLQFFNAAEITKIFSVIFSRLKPGGHLLINTWSIAEIVYKNLQPKSWSQVDNLKFLTESKLFFHPARLETESTIIAPDGKIEIKTAIDYIYSINEIEAMLYKEELSLKEIFSIPGKKKFTVGDPRAYIIAEKS